MNATRKIVLIALVAFLAGGAATYAAPKVAAGPWHVGIGKPLKPGVMAATGVTSSGLSADWVEACYSKDGSARYLVVYSTASNPSVTTALLVEDAACTKVTQSNGGALVYTTTGGADPVCTTAAGVVTRVNSLISAGATGGKLNLQ